MRWLAQAPERFRRWFPLNKFNAEVNAFITVLGFAWLVGPSEVKEVTSKASSAGQYRRRGWTVQGRSALGRFHCSITRLTRVSVDCQTCLCVFRGIEQLLGFGSL